MWQVLMASWTRQDTMEFCGRPDRLADIEKRNLPVRTRLPLLLLALSLTWPSESAMAQVSPESASAAPRPRAAPRVTRVQKSRGGGQVLVVSYPWKVHSRPSVEVRLVTGEDPGPSVIRPLFFVEDYLKGAAKVSLWRCQDKATVKGVREPLTASDVEFELVGGRNSLGEPSVCVVHRFEADKPGAGTAAIYCRLPAWAIDKRTLYLDLPREDFAERGKLYVWFLRQGTILWRETLDWPGQLKRRAGSKE